MICNQVKERVQALADSEVPPAEREEIEAHLSECASCRREVELATRNVRFLSSRLGMLAASINPDLGFLASLPPPRTAAPKPAETAPPAPSERTAPRIPVLVPILGIALLAAGAVWFALRGGGEPAPSDAPARPAPASESPVEPLRPDPTVPARIPERTPPSHPSIPSSGGVHPVAVRPSAVELVPQLLRTPSDTVLSRLWDTLKENPAQVRGILDALERAEDPDARALLTLALAGVPGDRIAVQKLDSLLGSDGDPGVRAAAAAALARTTKPEADSIRTPSGLTVPVGPLTDKARRARILKAAESERDPTALTTMIRILGPSQSEDETITQRFLELARGTDPRIRDAAIEAIRLGHPKDPRALESLVFDSEVPAEFRARLVEPAAAADPKSVVAGLKSILARSDSVEVKAAALRAMAKHPGKETWDVGVEYVRSGDSPTIRMAALGIVMGRHDKEAASLLEQIASSDSDDQVKAAAADAARLIRQELEREKK